MKRVLIVAATALFFLLLGVFLFLVSSFRLSLPKEKGEITVKGLTSDVKVVRDRFGVPHVFAQTDLDLFFAVGYIHAQDRMWQMELFRRVGFGRLSEIFGSQTVESDRYLRNLGFRDAALRDYENLSADVKEALVAYSDGVNAWMSERKIDWPPEFLLLRHRPEPWGVLDSLVIKEIQALTLCTDYPSELARAKLVKKVGREKALQILEEDIEDIPVESETQAFSVGQLARSSFSSAALGSNNWVVAGSRTESGRPLLANDPHLDISLPPIWYEIHLNSPGFDVVGVSFPGEPLVVIGHNAAIAWGVTNSGVDVQDVYIEKLDESRDSYFDGDGWKPLLKKEETIRVKGRKDPEKMDVLWTARGPLLSSAETEDGTFYSLRWTIQEGGRIFESLYLLNKARNWEEFCRAMELWDVPSQNFVYADVAGNIGYYLSGRIPLRDKTAALFPVPGWEEKNQWNGYLDEKQKPHVLNPESGYVVTANNRIFPADYQFYVGCDFDVPFRARRIEELILGRPKHSVDSFRVIQNDVLSKRAELVLPYIRKLQPAEEKARQACDILSRWNGEMCAGPEAALYSVFINVLQEHVFEDELGEAFPDFRRLFNRKQAGLLRILEDPSASWFDRKETSNLENRDDIFAVSLEKAHRWLEKKYGPPDKLDWTKIHALKFSHALGRVPVFSFFNRGPFPLDGDSFCIRASFGGDFSRDFATAGGASFRQIIDLADFRKSVCVLTSGQSGHFLSRHYDDQISLWLKGEYRPMLFSSEDIEANTGAVLVLKPSASKK
ncbi:MAG: penicillin acylase family protein [Clostridiales bacterium]|nr:penicillin acylase family protein [Clostridiales bacterium]